jgi:GGDEF domain-containing protein
MSEFWKRELIQWYVAIPMGTLVALGVDRVETVLNVRYGHAAGYAFLAAVAAYAASSMWIGAKRKKALTAQKATAPT